MIRSFADKAAQELWEKERSRKYAAIARVALRRLIQLNAAESLDDPRVLPGNHLEARGGDRVGQHSIRINRQHRICFAWSKDGPANVEIVDCH